MNHLPGETERCHYDYDPLDRQSASTHIAQLTRQRFHCKNRLATELQGTTRRSIFQFDDQLLAQQNYLAANVTATLLAIDHSRSVLNALDAAKIHSLAYSPYGHRPAQSGLLSLLGFNGEQPDPMTGHYHLGNGYRQFNPVLMRFNSPDSWSPFGKGGLNCYAYCTGDPMNRTDPTGHWHKQLLLKLHSKLPAEHFAPMAKAIQESKRSIGITAIEQLAITSNTSNEVVLYNEVISTQAVKIMTKIRQIKDALRTPDSPVKTRILLDAQVELFNATNIATELANYVPNTVSHQNAMGVVGIGKQWLDSAMKFPKRTPDTPDPNRVRST